MTLTIPVWALFVIAAVLIVAFWSWWSARNEGGGMFDITPLMAMGGCMTSFAVLLSIALVVMWWGVRP